MTGHKNKVESDDAGRPPAFGCSAGKDAAIKRARTSKPVARLTRPGRSSKGAGPDKEAGGRANSRALVTAINRDLKKALGPQVIEHITIKALRTNPRNARRHPAKQIAILASSIQVFGFIGALIIDESNMLLAGHGRFEAAKLAGMTEVPCVRVEHLTDHQKRAFALADNRMAELSVWDDEMLAAELSELSAPDLNLDFEFEVTGFDTVDIDVLTATALADKEPDVSSDPADDIPELEPASPAISREGDGWQLGNHVLVCGDALKDETYDQLLRCVDAVQVFTDPPYNVSITNHVTSVAGFREFAMASGEMTEEEFIAFLTRVLGLLQRRVANGAILHVCMDWRHASSILKASEALGLTVKNMCVWVKPGAGMGSFYRSQHELVFVLKAGDDAHINNFGLGARGRHRSNVWRYPSVVGRRTGVNDPKSGHPTVKPVALVMDAIRDCSKRGDIILDPFGGSGTTLIAAERVGRVARLGEIDPHYCDLIIRRWQALTGGQAVRMGDGVTFDEIVRTSRERDGSEDQPIDPADRAEEAL